MISNQFVSIPESDYLGDTKYQALQRLEKEYLKSANRVGLIDQQSKFPQHVLGRYNSAMGMHNDSSSIDFNEKNRGLARFVTHPFKQGRGLLAQLPPKHLQDVHLGQDIPQASSEYPLKILPGIDGRDEDGNMAGALLRNNYSTKEQLPITISVAPNDMAHAGQQQLIEEQQIVRREPEVSEEKEERYGNDPSHPYITKTPPTKTLPTTGFTTPRKSTPRKNPSLAEGPAAGSPSKAVKMIRQRQSERLKERKKKPK